MQNSNQITSTETIHIKLSKPIPELNQKVSRIMQRLANLSLPYVIPLYSYARLPVTPLE